MFKYAYPFFIKVLTPLHAGTGQELGIVDLPIQRERHTGFPKIEASGLKGSIREAFEDLLTVKNGQYALVDDETVKERVEKLKEIFSEIEKEIPQKDEKGNKKIRYNEAIDLTFGPLTDITHAGALGFTDARILLFPVKSMKGVFAYITCPQVLKRFEQEITIAGKEIKLNGQKINVSNIPSNSFPKNTSKVLVSAKVILEEYTFELKSSEDLKRFAEWLAEKTGIEEIPQKIVVLSDDDFKDFVHLSTEVITRIKIDNATGTVGEGPFNEEFLPAETILYSLALASPIFKEKPGEKGVFNQSEKDEAELVLEFFEAGIPEIMQIGGDATIGKGIVKIKRWDENKQEDK